MKVHLILCTKTFVLCNNHSPKGKNTLSLPQNNENKKEIILDKIVNALF